MFPSSIKKLQIAGTTLFLTMICVVTFHTYLKYLSKELVTSWLQIEQAKIEQGNLFSAITANSRFYQSGALFDGIMLFDISNESIPVELVSIGKHSVFKGDLPPPAGEIVSEVSGWYSTHTYYRFPNRTFLIIQFEISSKISWYLFLSLVSLLLVVVIGSFVALHKQSLREEENRIRLIHSAIEQLLSGKGLSSELAYSVPGLQSSWVRLNEQLHRLKEELKRNSIEKSISQTTQTIAHDLKGPLAVFQKIAFGNQQDYEHERHNLVKALNRLTSMADSIKRADLESQVRPYKSDLDLEETISSIQSYAEKHSISLKVDSTAIDGLRIDLSKVERAVSNLLFNAIEAANSYVEISWRILESQLIICVSDDGMGVPDELIPKLFTRGATFGKENGTGLGLAFVDHVAKGHGGKVEYQREGKTSMFKLVLEDVKVVDEPEAIEALDQKEGIIPINREQDSRILVKLKNSVEEKSLSKELRTKLGVVISNDFDDISECSILFTDDSSLLLRDYPEHVRLIMNRPEKAETVLRGLLEVKG